MSEFKLSILRNVGIAAIVFTIIFSVAIYASLDISNGGLGLASTTTTIYTSSSGTTATTNYTATTTANSNTVTYCASSTSENGDSVTSTQRTLLPAGSIISTISIPSPVGGIAYDSTLNRFYITGSNYFGGQGNLSDELIQINGASNQLMNFTYGGNQPVDVAYDQDNGLLYVADYASNSVLAVNATEFNTQIIKNISVGVDPVKVAYDPFNNDVYVSNRGSGTISVINTQTNAVQSTIPIGGSPFQFAYDAVNHEMYVTDGSSNLVTEINSTDQQIVRTINLGMGGGMIAYDSENHLLYDTSFGGASDVYAINGTGQVVANVTINNDPNAIGYDPANNEIYVAGNATGGFLYLISGSNNSIAGELIGQQNYTPQQIIPNSPLDTAMFMTSAYTGVYVLSNFANVSVSSSSVSSVTVIEGGYASTTTAGAVNGSSTAGSSGSSWTGYQLLDNCSGTFSASYSFPSGGQSGSQTMQPGLYEWMIYANNSWSQGTCYSQSGVVNNCPGIFISASPPTLDYYGGLTASVQFTVSTTSYAVPGLYFLYLPGVNTCTSNPILLIIGPTVPSSLPQLVKLCTTEIGSTNPFNPSVSLIGASGFNQVTIPIRS